MTKVSVHRYTMSRLTGQQNRVTKQVFRDEGTDISWFHDRKESVLWTRDMVASVVCVVFGEHLGAMFNYNSQPAFSDIRAKGNTSYRQLAEQMLVQITYLWEETQDAEGLTFMTKMGNPRIFLFLLDDYWLCVARKSALSWLEKDIPQVIVPGGNAKIVRYLSHKSYGFALVDVYHTGTNILPKVLLNMVQQAPAIPRFKETGSNNHARRPN